MSENKTDTLVVNSILQLLLIILLAGSCTQIQSVALNVEVKASLVPVFVNGESGYQCFRIPAIVKANNGHLIAFSEGRKMGCSDTGDIDLLSKKSTDGGASWGPLEIIWNDSLNTCGNPAPIVDQMTGDIFLLSTWNLGEDHESEIIAGESIDTRRIFVMRSKDNGATWSAPKEITADVKLPDWSWYATGPGSGTQLTKGVYKGRLILGCDHIEQVSKKYYSHVIYSDDHGETWNLGGTTPKDQVNECEVVELENGELLLNMRNYVRDQKFRQTAISKDGGLSWEKQQHDDELIEPICQGSIQSISSPNKRILAFSNPADTSARKNLTVRISENGGGNWTDIISVYAGPSAYSDLVDLGDQEIGCFFEYGVKSPYERIGFVKLTLTP